MKTQAKTDTENVPRRTSGTVTIETKAHIFRKGESNGFCEWFGCEFISVMGLIQGKNLIELHYSEEETVFVCVEASEIDRSITFYVNDCGGFDVDLILQLYKVCRFVFYNCENVLSTKLLS